MIHKIDELYPPFIFSVRGESSIRSLDSINWHDENKLSIKNKSLDNKDTSLINQKELEERLKKLSYINILRKEYNKDYVNINFDFDNLNFTHIDLNNQIKGYINNIYIFNNNSKSDPPIMIDSLKKLDKTLQILSYFNGSFEKTVHFLNNSDFNYFYFNDDKLTNSINVKYLFTIKQKIKMNKLTNTYNISFELLLRQILIM